MTADVELPEILRDIAAGRRNSVGDHWSRDYCDKAAAEIEALRAEVEVLLTLANMAGPRRRECAVPSDYLAG